MTVRSKLEHTPLARLLIVKFRMSTLTYARPMPSLAFRHLPEALPTGCPRGDET
jgi:hypothetical protein